MKLGVRTLLGAIFEAKKTGKGRIGRGKIYAELMKIITDGKGDISSLFGGNTDRFLLRLLRGETDYPYLLFRFDKFEKSVGNSPLYQNYIFRMTEFCNTILDENKIEQLAYTLIESIRQDDNITKILYGSEYISKDKFFGSYAHPKRICIEALLLGLLYHVHKNPAESKNIELLDLPEKSAFHVVRFYDKNSLDLEIPIDFIENIHENTKRQKSVEMKYKLELRNGNEIINEIPNKGNIFLSGVGGVGKSTLLLNQIGNKNTINFYFPLYKYKQEIHENLQSESCWILLQILLKYHYQYEYQTYETCVACEGENAILQQLKELKNLLKPAPIDDFAKYTLLLDGINELPSESQEHLVDELKYIVSEWKNVRIVITGRTVPMYDVFDDFQQLEICGVPNSERDRALSESASISANEKILELLKTPLFLNMYLENNGAELNTRGEILDSYVMNIQSRLPQDSAMRFVVQYALPFAAKMMTDGFSYEIDRGDLSEAIDNAAEFYLKNERIYQNYIAPKKFRKKNLLESMGETDFTELLIENICFLAVSSQEPQKLHFTHQYFRDYFAAKHILNLAEALSVSYEYKHTDERTELFKKYELDMMWFYDEDDIYRLIGEISGDYKNAPCEDFIYQRTILDSILDMARNISNLHTAECVMKSMSLVRDGVLCEVDFSETNLPMYIPSNVKFSLNGEYPCSFRDCWVFFFSLYNLPACCTTYSDDKKFLLITFENGFVILWDNMQKCIIWDKDFSDFTEDGIEFEYAYFDDDNSVITLVSCKSELEVDVTTGELIKYKNAKKFDIIDEFFDCTGKYPSTRTDLDNDLKLEIFSQLPHFRNCDFTGAEFFDDEGEKLLKIMGAFID